MSSKTAYSTEESRPARALLFIETLSQKNFFLIAECNQKFLTKFLSYPNAFWLLQVQKQKCQRPLLSPKQTPSFLVPLRCKSTHQSLRRLQSAVHSEFYLLAGSIGVLWGCSHWLHAPILWQGVLYTVSTSGTCVYSVIEQSPLCLV